MPTECIAGDKVCIINLIMFVSRPSNVPCTDIAWSKFLFDNYFTCQRMDKC